MPPVQISKHMWGVALAIESLSWNKTNKNQPVNVAKWIGYGAEMRFSLFFSAKFRFVISNAAIIKFNKEHYSGAAQLLITKCGCDLLADICHYTQHLLFGL